MNLKRVIVETPYKAKTKKSLKQNLEFARACAHDCLVTYCEAPFLSHLLYTQPGILDDSDTQERKMGIDAGLSWGAVAEATVIYLDRGISISMYYGVQNAIKANRPIFFRTLNGRVPALTGKPNYTSKIQVEPNQDSLTQAIRQLIKDLPYGSRAFYVISDLDHLDDIYGPTLNFDGFSMPVLISPTPTGNVSPTIAIVYEK